MSAEALRAFVADFRRMTLRSATAGGLISGQALSDARRTLEVVRFERFDLAHRGAYDVSLHPLPEALAAELGAVASAAVGRPVSPRAHRWMRFGAGDYSLQADDERWDARPRMQNVLDLTLDLSSAATGEAEVVFTHDGVAYFTVPQRPGQVGIAERSPAIGRYDRYLTRRVEAAVVVRLRALLV